MSAPVKVFLVWGVNAANGYEEYTLLEVHATREGADRTMEKQPTRRFERVEIGGCQFDWLESDEREVIA